MDIANQIQNLKQIAEDSDQKVLVKELETLFVKQREERFYVAILGLFKRGKSTIINALLNQQVLPSAVIPVTSIITLIEHSDHTSAEIYFSNGDVIQKDISVIEDFIAEEKNPENEKGIDFVKIFHPASILENISIVDTPGIGSVLLHNSETTKSFIPKIDTALYVLSADMPITQTDIDFIKDLKHNVPKILFVLNKVDLLDETDLQKMIQHNLTALNKIMEVSRDELITVSARFYEKPEGNMNQLSSRLTDLAKAEKKELLEQSVFKRYEFLRNELKNEIQFILKMKLMPLNELEEKKNILQSSVKVMTQQKEEFESIMNGKIKSMQNHIHQAMNEEGRHLTETVNKEISGISNSDEQSFLLLNKRLKSLILATLETIKESLEERTKESFKDLLVQTAGRSENFLNELSTNLDTYLGMDFKLISEKFDLDIYTSFYLTVSSSSDSETLKSPGFNKLLPASVRKKQLIKKLQDHYKEIIITDTAAIGYDLQYKIQESFRKFNYDLNNRLNELLDNLENKIEDTIASKKINEQASEEEINKMHETLEQIDVLALK
ncbi:MAG: dynamin family protein [Ginsengibacter sp.]